MTITDQEKIDLLDKIIEIAPEIKKKREIILTHIIAPKNTGQTELVFEKIIINNMAYYKDKMKGLYDESYELVGLWTFMKSKNDYEYYIFTNESDKIKNNKQIVLSLI